MGDYSAITYEFQREKVDDDNSSLYTSMRHARDISTTMDNKRLRSLVADYIRKNTNLHQTVLESGSTNCKTAAEYCNKIEKGTVKGGLAEVQALANISRALIYLIKITKNAQGELDITISDYGESAGTECVYMVYDEKNQYFYPLYLINKQNPEEKCKDFQSDNKTILEILHEFIRKEFHYDGFIRSNDEPTYEMELSTETTLLNETETLSGLITPNAAYTTPKTSKIPNHEELSLSQITEKESSPSTPVNVVNESADDNNCKTMPIEQYLQKNPFGDEDEHAPVVLNGTIRFEIDPVREFRGRTNHEFKPKKPLKRNKQPSIPRSPRYFADLNNNHFLNLLIPEELLLPGVEYRFKISLITSEIDQCSYYHSYFKFQMHSTDKGIPNENPIYITPNDINLKDYVQGQKKLILQLVVVMHTNNELMQSVQPLPLFSSLNNGSPITAIFDNHESFKQAYNLHKLRFAVNLESRLSGERAFRRHDDIQYISETSTEDKNAKVPKNH